MTMRNCLMLSVAAMSIAIGGPAALGANLLETLESRDEFKTFARAVKQAGYAEMLSKEGPFTVFAPTDAAFQRLPESTVQELMTEAYAEDLDVLVRYHIVEGPELETEPLMDIKFDVVTLKTSR